MQRSCHKTLFPLVVLATLASQMPGCGRSGPAAATAGDQALQSLYQQVTWIGRDRALKAAAVARARSLTFREVYARLLPRLADTPHATGGVTFMQTRTWFEHNGAFVQFLDGQYANLGVFWDEAGVDTGYVPSSAGQLAADLQGLAASRVTYTAAANLDLVGNVLPNPFAPKLATNPPPTGGCYPSPLPGAGFLPHKKLAAAGLAANPQFSPYMIGARLAQADAQNPEATVKQVIADYGLDDYFAKGLIPKDYITKGFNRDVDGYVDIKNGSVKYAQPITGEYVGRMYTGFCNASLERVQSQIDAVFVGNEGAQ